MEEMIMGKQNFLVSPAPCPLSIHRDSRPIAKIKPKIRIIHIFEPEIIKTDVANFRELVQRLTGKPAATDHHHRPTASGKRNRGKFTRKSIVEDPVSMMSPHTKPLMMTMKMEPLNSFIGNTSHHEDYFSSLSDIDRFMQDISELPLLPMDPSHHIHSSFGTSQLT